MDRGPYWVCCIAFAGGHAFPVGTTPLLYRELFIKYFPRDCLALGPKTSVPTQPAVERDVRIVKSFPSSVMAGCFQGDKVCSILYNISIEGLLAAFRACNPTTKDAGWEDEFGKALKYHIDIV